MRFIEYFQKNQASYRAAFLDIDGTFLQGSKIMPGAEELLEEFKSKNFPFFFLTNDGSSSLEQKQRQLKKCRLEVETDQIISCSSALNDFVLTHNLQGDKFFVLGTLGEPDYAQLAGLKVEHDVKKIYECAGVICGGNRYDWAEGLTAVFNFFCHFPERFFIVPNPDSFYPCDKVGNYGICGGAKARFLQELWQDMNLDVQLHYLGKPHPPIFEYAVKRLKNQINAPTIDPSTILMLGDSLSSDIAGANRHNLSSVLLTTGVSSKEKALAADGIFKPAMIFESL